MDTTNFFEIDNSSVEQAPFAIKFIFNCWHRKDEWSVRYTKVSYSDFFFFANYRDYRMFWELNKIKECFTEDLKPINSESIKPYFKEFAKGFHYGYSNYESKIKRNTSIFVDIQSNAEQIFRTINLNKCTLCSYKPKEVNKKFLYTLNKELYYNNGLLMGENYRAWQIIIENPQYFIDKFLSSEKYIRIYKNSVGYLSSHEMYSGILEALLTLINSLPPEHSETVREQVIPTFKNNFDNVKPTEIYNHFKAGLVEKGYLTEQELNEYLRAAFELKKIPQTLFKLRHTPTKQKIYTVFYVYYKDISQKKHERQKEYAALLGNYFEGYKTEIIKTNWARGYNAKR